MTRCNKCLLDDKNPGIVLDEQGTCNYCHWQEGMERKYKILDEYDMANLAERCWKNSNSTDYDCIIGVSGGVDSSYLLTKAVLEWGLRPLAVTFDDGWNTRIAQDNIRKLVDKLEVDLYTYVVDYEEMNDIYRSFIKARVPDTDAPTDIAIAKVLRMAAKKHGIKTILDAHNFRTEGTTPLGWLYFDGAYVKSVHQAYGAFPMTKPGENSGGFPNLTMRDMIWDNTRKLRPLYHMQYSRGAAVEYLQKEIGWTQYSQHHGENLWTLFSNYAWMPRVFDLDLREVFLSAQIRSGILPREGAADMIKQPPMTALEERRVINEVTRRLDISDEEAMRRLARSAKLTQTHDDFNTYADDFKRLRPLFWAMKKMGLVNETFYNKYCIGV